MSTLNWTTARVWMPCCRRTLAAAVLWSAFVSSMSSAADLYKPGPEYPRGAVVLAADGNEYRAVEPVKDKDPVTAKKSPWRLAHAAFDLTLDVPGRFATIPEAMQFIAGSTIADTAMVTVQLAPGTYEFREPLAVGHHDGRRLVLKGVKDPAKVILDFNGGGGLVIDGSRSIRLETVTLEGVRKDQTGILVDNGSSLIGDSIAINGFGLGVFANHGSVLELDHVTVTSENGVRGIALHSLSRGRMTDCRAVRTKRDEFSGESLGFEVEYGAAAECHTCVASGWTTGFLSGCGSTLTVWQSEAKENVWGAAVYLNASFNASDCTFRMNAERGVDVYGGVASLHDCRIRDNKKYGVVAAGNGLVHFHKKPCLIKGHTYGLYSYAGRMNGVMPTMQENDEDKHIEFTADKKSDAVFMLTPN